MNLSMKNKVITNRFLYSTGLLILSLVVITSCGRSKTKKLLLNKKWEVYNVTPPGGIFNVEQSNRAKELKDGFYKNAWFKFLPDSIFIASFSGKADSGKYHISAGGKTISLYPKQGNKIYEQIQIRKLTNNRLSFNTVIADFHLILHLKSTDSIP